MIAVRVPLPHEYDTALRLLYHGLSPVEQQARVDDAIAAIGRGELFPQGLLLAEAEGKPVGALLSALQPDKTAFVWPPAVLVDSVSNSIHAEDVADALLQTLNDRCDSSGVWLGQCLLEPNDRHSASVMARNGYPHLTNLRYLERASQPPLPLEVEVPLDTLTYDPSQNRPRFEQMIEETYRRTLDCPELNGLRTAGEALDSHRCSGRFDPARWKIYRADDEDVGILLLNDHPEQDAWEIVYFGIAEHFRGRGYGRAMLVHGCRETFTSGRGSVLVAVDDRNSYALKVYREVGFAEIGTKSVHARIARKVANLD